MEPIKALSVMDGRYQRLTSELVDIFSEFGLIYHRVQVEIEWLKFILTDLKLAPMDAAGIAAADAVLSDFTEADALRVKVIEKTTNHDVKAVEYFIKEKLTDQGFGEICEWVHFACTSDDINNTAYALMVKKGRDVAAGHLSALVGEVEKKALEYRSDAMMSRTHGQPATPTTMGKEFVNFAWRFDSECRQLIQAPIQAKINGATGSYNAHSFVFPDIDWITAGERFLSNQLDLSPLYYTTQINPNAYLSGILHILVRSAAAVIDFDRDMWGYISLGYFRQHLAKGETGSSTMPHKVNPIDFENSEGNMGMAISMMEHMAVKLQQSRFQRDLSDSTVLRGLGTLFGYYVIGVKNCIKGLGKVALDREVLLKDLTANPVLLAEPFQSAMRVFGEPNPYERLKDLTRGQTITRQTLDDFVDRLEKVPPDVKARMKALTPQTYLGVAEQLVDHYFAGKKG